MRNGAQVKPNACGIKPLGEIVRGACRKTIVLTTRLSGKGIDVTRRSCLYLSRLVPCDRSSDLASGGLLSEYQNRSSERRR